MNTDNKLIAEAYAQKLHENKPRKITVDTGIEDFFRKAPTSTSDVTPADRKMNPKKPAASATATQPSAGDTGIEDFFRKAPTSTSDVTPADRKMNPKKPTASATATDTPTTVNSTVTGAAKPAFEPRDMPDNWQNASWAKRARSMGRGNRKRTQELAAKEWKRHEAMRQEREQATARGESDFVNQIKKIPGNIRGAVNSLATGRKPIMTDAGDIKRDDQGKLMFEPKKQKADPVSTAAPTAASADKYHRDQFRKSLSPRERMNLRPGSRGYSQKYRQYMKTAQSPVQPESYSAFDDVLNKHGVQNLLDG